MTPGPKSAPQVIETYAIAVRELCEFAAKSGDLDHRFTPSPTAQEGIAGHQVVAARRGSRRRNEVVLAGQFKQLRVRGRADGYLETEGVLEEVKTYRGDLDRMPANHRSLHWAQAKVYAALLCAQQGLSEIKVALIYFEISRQQETTLVEDCRCAELQAFFEGLCQNFLAWGVQELEHRKNRDDDLAHLRFPHDSYRQGQRELAENVYRAARHGRCLMAQAPTGIGKTVATLFPLLKACAKEGVDKVFYLTAKGAGQQLARDTVDTIRRAQPGLRLRVIELVSRDKSCEHPGKACHGESCPLARGFYDRLPAARAEVVVGALSGREAIREVALRHTICPYYLTQELVRWSDVVIADYNYLFDTTATLYLLTLTNEWKAAVLVDEAHNLVERARAMYSASLSESNFREARKNAPPSVAPQLDRLSRAWRAISKTHSAPYVLHESLPDRLVSCLAEVCAGITDCMAEAPEQIDADLLRFYFDALHFQRMSESFGAHSMFDATTEPTLGRSIGVHTTLSIRNIVPATFLHSRFAASVTTVLFSATLTPHSFYANMLGLPKDTTWLDVPPPFQRSQLVVKVESSISTRFADRDRSLLPIAQLIELQFRREPGNYLAFFSSFDYLDRAAATFTSLSPSIPVWMQARRQGDVKRAAFLERFTADSQGIGFAVLGGSFGEGVDLPGRRLIGAFIATLGLPQVNPVNEQLRRVMGKMFGAGYEYAYLYPGLRKVVQAAGRVIRTASDRGTVVLIDDRFQRQEVRALFPAWWRPDNSPHGTGAA